ncbi:GNAT family N-acetyltransferase [Methylobacterium sp. J-090]|uniref:GNAT family N-acetyltransferase n=1 Tax=Methylobacterium sp. J-090 TaxID=2836666 RepID=UPI001FBB54AE|nr:GNAT family N-acetyltransferase [Methylobacterium sp. J-090]MCJ2080929.1 GNAT family N-acetyltransferase [Methylobacterium sp. J-090]
METLRWRAMVPGDLPAVVALADALFSDHYEAPERFAERLRASPSLCRVLARETGAIRGYWIAYPWPLGRVPPLNRPLPEPLADAGALYLHDLGLHPDARGHGHARQAVADLAAGANAAAIALVAVNGSSAFWAAQGFCEAPYDSVVAEKLEGYGPDARYMIRRP